MSSYKYIIPLIIIVLILSTITLAESGISVAPIKNLIKPNEKAVYQITINNTLKEKQRYTLYSLNAGLGWDIETKPIKDKIIEIEPLKSYTTTLIIRPQDAYPPGIYAVNLNLESDFGEKQTLPIKVYIKWKRFWLVVLAGVIGIFLVMPYLAPTWEAYRLSPRDFVKVTEIRSIFLVQWSHILSLFNPDWLGNPGTYNYLGTGSYYDKALFIGVIPLVFVIIGTFLKKTTVQKSATRQEILSPRDWRRNLGQRSHVNLMQKNS